MFTNSGYRHLKPGDSQPPACITQAEYEECKVPEDETDPKNENKVVRCPITLEELNIKDVVKLPQQPNICYDRNALRDHFKTNKRNPMTNENLENTDWFKGWYNKNMGDQECVSYIGGHKGKKKSRKSHIGGKKTRKSCKGRKSNKSIKKRRNKQKGTKKI
jgi:hypothetical protein